MNFSKKLLAGLLCVGLLGSSAPTKASAASVALRAGSLCVGAITAVQTLTAAMEFRLGIILLRIANMKKPSDPKVDAPLVVGSGITLTSGFIRSLVCIGTGALTYYLWKKANQKAKEYERKLEKEATPTAY